MLSPAEGQELAQIAGFSAASKDVADVEFIDTLAKWTVMALSGALEIGLESSKWMSEFLGTRNRLSDEEVKRYEIIFYGFAAALIGLLMDKDIVDLHIEPDEDSPVEQLSSMLSILFPAEGEEVDEEDE